MTLLGGKMIVFSDLAKSALVVALFDRIFSRVGNEGDLYWLSLTIHPVLPPLIVPNLRSIETSAYVTKSIYESWPN